MEPPATPPAGPRRDHSLRTGLLLAAGVVVIAVAILGVAVVVVLHRVGDAVGPALRDVSPENPGAPDRLTVAEGAGFTFHDERFGSGWSLAHRGRDSVRPEGLRFVSEDGSASDAAGLLDVRLYRRGTVLGVSHCRSTHDLRPGSSNEMRCTSVFTGGSSFDRIEVADFSISTQ